MNLLILLGIAAAAALGSSIKTTANTKTFLGKKVRTSYIPKAISMLILTAQVSELVRVVEHTSIVSVSAALLLLAIVVATKSGSEEHAR